MMLKEFQIHQWFVLNIIDRSYKCLIIEVGSKLYLI